jgi:hypothetical protein
LADVVDVVYVVYVKMYLYLWGALR